MRTRVHQRPSEHGGLALTAGLYAALLSLAVFEAVSGGGPGTTVARGAAALLAALAWVTAEAIWNVRPWAYRAGRMLAWSTLAALALSGAFMVAVRIPWHARGWLLMAGTATVVTLVMAGIVAALVLPMVDYLRRTSAGTQP